MRTFQLSAQADAVANPWCLQLQKHESSPDSLSPGTAINEVYEQSLGSLLLLGRPGAGKTTLLLTLARDLVARARNDELQPIPVVLNLSTWTTRQRTLDGWLFAELAARYDIERHYARHWLRADLLVLLLDGLDEVAEEARPSCIEAINMYYREHPAVHVVVCGREDEYLAQSARLDLNCQAHIQPLTARQVEQYFDAAQGRADASHRAWRSDAGLQELLQTPLMLTLTLLTYNHNSPFSLPIDMSVEEQREQIFAAYAGRVLAGEARSHMYTDEQTRHWLWWIARQMHLRGQTVFYPENVQPAWLPTAALRRSFSVLFGLMAGLPFVPLVALLIGGARGLASGVMAGLIVGLLCSLPGGARSEIRLVDDSIVLLRGLRGNIFFWALGGFMVGVLGFSVGGLLYGLIILLLYGLLVWVVGPVGPVGSVGKMRTGSQRARSDWRIWRSGQNGLAIGLLTAFGLGLLGVPFGALYIGLLVGTFIGLVAGGSAFVRHFLLRFLLSRPRAGYLPRDLLAFLDSAAERSLLYKVAGGYIFPHQLLLDHFASLDSRLPVAVKTAS
ncbi:MAG: hypothetical protein PVS3B1_27810 [Ktedonobacteraceae bacterium]